MSSKATRRLFLAGAALAAPAAVASAAAASGGRADDLGARLAALEDRAALRALGERYIAEADSASLGAGVVGLSLDGVGEPVIEVAADRAAAVARFACVARTETPITPSCTLVEMARAQGEGVVRGSERRTLEIAFERADGAWSIARAATAPLAKA
jgi:hypothetical protein